jgi:proline iminopeptidase
MSEQYERTIAEIQEIHSPEGISISGAVEIGGVKQWISIRGVNRQNPILLLIHGGPGTPISPISWAFQKPWEDFLTVVQWDQRGVGLNWSQTDPKELSPTITHGQLASDAEEVIEHVCTLLGKQSLILMGWSYGTITATAVAQRIPNRVSAYVGVGQVAKRLGSERYVYEIVLELARKQERYDAVEELGALSGYPANSGDLLGDVRIVRKWVRHFGGSWYGVGDLQPHGELWRLSPSHGHLGAGDLNAASDWFVKALHKNDGLQVDGVTGEGNNVRYDVPVLILMGRFDLQTPYTKARDYFDTIQAPHKRFITLERSSHFPMLEEPGRFLRLLMEGVSLIEGGDSRCSSY